jgi:hypothetical protein
MQYLILAVLLLLSGEVKSDSYLSCESVQEISETVLDAPGLTLEQKNKIIGRLYGRHLAGCSEFVEDANVDEGTG